MMTNEFKEIRTNFYNLCTGFQQIMWKSQKSSFFTKACLLLLCLFLIASCSWSKNMAKSVTDTVKAPFAKKEQPVITSSLISMSEDDIRKKLGEPTVVSLTPENHILWTYYPEWKVMPDNKDTVYLEFEEGKVIKAMKAKQ